MLRIITKHLGILLCLLAVSSCKPDSVVPEEEDTPALPEGAVVWLDLTRWNDGNARGMSQKGFKAYAGFSPNGIVP